MTYSAELARLQPFVERARAFSGWDLGFIGVRLLDDGPPWDYEAIASERIRGARRAIDFGTGGGEVLGRLLAGRAPRANSVIATEQWHVNAPLARERLREFGVPVIRCDSERPPLRDTSFDLVLSRHEAIEPAEADRILVPGGIVLTQQVTPDVWPELRRFFPRATLFPDHFRGYGGWFRRHGYAVSLERHDYHVAWESLGDLVVHLLVAPWTIPDFEVERDIGALLALEAALTGPEGIVMTEGRYLLEATKPG